MDTGRRGPLARAAWIAAALLVAGSWWNPRGTGALPVPVHFGSVAPTPVSMTIAGYLTFGGSLPQAGAELAAYDPDGVLCGVSGVNPTSGAFILHVYGDAATTAEDEGATPGDALALVAYDPSTGLESSGTALTWSVPLPPFTDKGSFRRDGDGPAPPVADRDGDGWADAVDVFPDDSDEWLDTDGDGVGNNGDPDDDGDGFADAEEVAAGADPLDWEQTPLGARPLPPVILDIDADPAAPLTAFEVDLEPFSDPDEPPGAAPTGVEWALRLADPDCEVCRVEFWLAAVPTRLELVAGLLDPDAEYRFAARWVDHSGLASAWSEPFPVTTENDPRDEGGDGVEDRAFVAGETNLGAATVVFREPQTDLQVELTPPAGVQVERLYVTRRDELPAELLPDAEIPYGLYSFRLGGLPAGQPEVEVTFRFPAPLPPGTGWVKVDPVTGALDYSDRVTVDGSTAVLRLTDGGRGDGDGVENSVIVDPGGPALFPEGPSASSGGGGGCFLRALLAHL